MAQRFVFLRPRFAAPLLAGLVALACVDQQPAGPRSVAKGAAALTASVQPSQTTPTDQHVVVMTGAIPGDFASRVEALGGTVAATYPDIGVAVTSGLSDAAAAALARTSGVGGVDRDLSVQWIPSLDQVALQAVAAPSDQTNQSGAFFFNFYQWNLKQIQANAAWLTTNQGAGTRVAILDTGTDPTHIDLAGKIDLANSASMITSSPCAGDVGTIFDHHFHGSFVSGIVSTNGIGAASVAPDAQLIAVKVLNCTGSGSFASVIAGIVHATNVGADVINMSLGAYFPKNLPGAGQLVAALNRATSYANGHGTLVVAAAGNGAVDTQHDQNFIFVPAQSSNVISVGATGPFQQTNFDQLAFYTNFGVSGVDLMAPGGNQQAGGDPFFRDGILSVCSHFSPIFGGICGTGNFWLLGGDGTSFASPHTAGTAAVVKSQFPGASPSQLQHCLYKGADDLGKPGVDQQYSHGRINVVGAAQC
jgi:lantibiotic leader peptide-processing serine protease